MLKVYLHWLDGLSPIRSMWPKSIMSAYAAADACAHGTHAQIGGFLKIADSTTIWFSESFSPMDFISKSIPMNQNAQRDITCYETLAQLAILKLASSVYPSCRFPIRIASLSDNTGAEAGSNCLFSTKQPMCFSWKKFAFFRHLPELNWMSVTLVEQRMKWLIRFHVGMKHHFRHLLVS